jgi:hypothetical protein
MDCWQEKGQIFSFGSPKDNTPSHLRTLPALHARGGHKIAHFVCQIMNVSSKVIYHIGHIPAIAFDMIDVHEICRVAISPQHDRRAVDSTPTSIRNAETS